jgi:hypothetical protein
LLNQDAPITFDSPVRSAGSIVAGDWIAFYVRQDASGGRPKPVFEAAYGPDVSDEEIALDANTQSIYQLTFDGDQWHVDSFVTGKRYA